MSCFDWLLLENFKNPEKYKNYRVRSELNEFPIKKQANKFVFVRS